MKLITYEKDASVLLARLQRIIRSALESIIWHTLTRLHVISELSRGMTLKPETIISMGTPAGVSMCFDPPKFLKPGDVVYCEIEGIGTLTNTVR